MLEETLNKAFTYTAYHQYDLTLTDIVRMFRVCPLLHRTLALTQLNAESFTVVFKLS